MKHRHRTLVSIVSILIVIWVLLAITRTAYNFTKLLSEERYWFFLSNEEKKHELYGDPYEIFKSVDTLTEKNDSILLISSDGWPFFYGRYALYPKKVYWEKLIKKRKGDSYKEFSYVLLFNPSKRDAERYDFLVNNSTRKVIKHGAVTASLIKIK